MSKILFLTAFNANENCNPLLRNSLFGMTQLKSDSFTSHSSTQQYRWKLHIVRQIALSFNYMAQQRLKCLIVFVMIPSSESMLFHKQTHPSSLINRMSCWSFLDTYYRNWHLLLVINHIPNHLQTYRNICCIHHMIPFRSFSLSSWSLKLQIQWNWWTRWFWGYLLTAPEGQAGGHLPREQIIFNSGIGKPAYDLDTLYIV